MIPQKRDLEKRMNRLKDKIAIVTGSTGGIGLATASLYAAEGAKVIVCGRRKERGEAVVKSIVDAGGYARYHYMDLDDLKSIETLMEDVAEEFGRIDVLVNNAANVFLKDGRVDELSVDMWDAIFRSDLRGTFYAIKCVLPYMRPHGGSIVNIGSMASCSGDLGATAYAAAKAGVDMLTQSVALQYGKDNIRCNCVRPGLIVTPDNEARIPDALKKIFMDNINVNRCGQPSDIGHLCVYLGSDESYYVTGQIMTVDGGLNSHVPTSAQFRNLGSRTW